MVPTDKPIRIRGVVTAPRPGSAPFRRVSLVADGKTVATLDEGEIEIALAGGGTATVEVPAEGTKILDPIVTVTEGTWGELRDGDAAAGLVRNVVPPFTEVTLKTTDAPVGEPIEAFGEVFEYELDDTTATLRDAPTRRPSRMSAQIVAFGPPDKMQEMAREISRVLEAQPKEEAPPPAPAKRKPDTSGGEWFPTGVLSLLAAGGLALLLFAHMNALNVWRVEVLTLVAVALAFAIRPSLPVPDLHVGDKTLEASFSFIFVMRLVFCGGISAILLGSLTEPDRSGPGPLGYLVGGVAVLGGWALTVVVNHRQMYVALATLAGASRVSAKSKEEQIGTFEGQATVARPVTVDGQKAALGLVVEMNRHMGKRNPDTEKSRKLLTGKGIVVEAEGWRVQIDPDECVWGTTARRQPTERNPSSFSYTISEWIPAGGKIAVFGRVSPSKGKATPTWRLSAVGKQAAVLFATTSGEPIAVASGIVWRRRVTLAWLFATAGMLVALYLRQH